MEHTFCRETSSQFGGSFGSSSNHRTDGGATRHRPYGQNIAPPSPVRKWTPIDRTRTSEADVSATPSFADTS
jgi:hypothetical protein